MMLDFASNVSGTYGALSVPLHDGGAAYTSQTPTLRKIIQSYSSDMIMTMDHPECGDSCSKSVNISLKIMFLFQDLREEYFL
jgi:hypothetical protein